MRTPLRLRRQAWHLFDFASTMTTRPTTRSITRLILCVTCGWALALFSHGSGAQPVHSLKLLAQALAQGGWASVRYDKRGVAASAAAGPREADLRFDTYVQDAAAWLRLLHADSRFGPRVVLGHSEGALMAMLAAASR